MPEDRAATCQPDALHRLLELSVATADADSVKDVARVLTEVAAPLVGAANAAVATWAAGDDVIRVFQGPTATKGNESLRLIELAEPTPLTDAIRNRAEVHVWSSEAFAERFPKIARRTRAGEVTAMATYPLLLRNEVLGSCFFRFADNSTVDSAQTDLMEMTVPLLARALARIRDRDDAVLYARRLEQSNRDLDDFAAVVAHDLSAPVRRIGSFLQLLLRELEPLSGKSEKYASTIHNQVQHLDALLRDTLAYAQVVTPKDEAQSIALRELATSVVDTMAGDLADLGAEVVVDDLPVAHAEESLIRQVLQNLIDNSVKYRAFDRPLRIHIDAEPGPAPAGHEPPMVRIAMHDNGIGIDPSHADEIFQMFTRLDVSHDRPGTGVGLAFVKRVIERHGGEVGLGPRRDEGTSIWFTLPAARTADLL